MSSRMHRRAGWSLAIGYLIASTCFGTWHSHREPHDCQHADCQFSAADASVCDHDRRDLWIENPGDAQRPGSMPEDDCAVCRFLAQSALPAIAVALPTLGEVVVEARIVAPVCPQVWVATGGPARAPPSVA